MEKIAAFLLGLFEGMKLPFRWVAVLSVLGLVIVGMWGYERITANFYLTKLERKVAILKELQSLADAGVETKPELKPVYASAVNELRSLDISQPILPALPPINLSATAFWKGLSGSIIWLLVLVVGVSSEAKKAGKVTGTVLGVAILLILIALGFAWLGTLIPTIYNPWVNYLGFPAIQAVVLILLSRRKPAPSN